MANLGGLGGAVENDRWMKHGTMKRQTFLIELGGWERDCEILLEDAGKQPPPSLPKRLRRGPPNQPITHALSSAS